MGRQTEPVTERAHSKLLTHLTGRQKEPRMQTCIRRGQEGAWDIDGFPVGREGDLATVALEEVTLDSALLEKVSL